MNPKGYAILVVFVEYQWYDQRLGWGENGTDCLFLEYKDIWTPPMRFRRPIVYQENDLNPEYPVRVCSDGYIYLEHYCRVIIPAYFDIRDFPFDRHKIDMWFRHPTGGIQEINPHSVITSMDEIEFQLDVANIEWKLLNYSCRKAVFESEHEFKPQTYAFITCEMEVQRKAGFFCINFCIPSMAVTTLCTLATHSATSVTGARTSKYNVGMQALMAYGVYTVSLTQAIPRSSVVSRLHTLFLSQIGIVFSSCMVSWANVVLERSHKKNPNVKVYLRYVDFASLLCHWFLIASLGLWFFSGP